MPASVGSEGGGRVVPVLLLRRGIGQASVSAAEPWQELVSEGNRREDPAKCSHLLTTNPGLERVAGIQLKSLTLSTDSRAS
eukprot:454491-Hanusia_phi.AAC.1